MEDIYQNILSKLNEADGILIGASNGLSISEGIHIFADNADFRDNFWDYREKYGLRSIIQGCFYPFPMEEKWAFFSRVYSYFLYNKTASPVMKNLYELVKNKNYFVVTSNIDDHFRLAGFPPDRLFEIEGNCRNLQCSQGCHNSIYPGDSLLIKMAKNQQEGKIPQALIPACPQCGGRMQVNMEVDRNFLKGDSWQTNHQNYQKFIHDNRGKKLVLLELGVGARNQLIKAPFMKLTSLEENVTYITFNRGSDLYIPTEITDKSIGMDGDIAEMLEHLASRRGK